MAGETSPLLNPSGEFLWHICSRSPQLRWALRSEGSLEMAAEEPIMVNGGFQVFQEDLDLDVRWQPAVKSNSQYLYRSWHNRRGIMNKVRASPSSDGYAINAMNGRAPPRSVGQTKQQDIASISELRIGTWNIASMTGWSAELSDILNRRRINNDKLEIVLSSFITE